ncbi:MAG: hypothetical protein RRA94_11740, partial [Bacteroidota bacterium]|nr:hypothetical protein [Bacteroidota bacterium]
HDGDSSINFRWKQFVPPNERRMVDSLLREHRRQLDRLPRQLRLELEKEIQNGFRDMRPAPPELPPAAPRPDRGNHEVLPAPQPTEKDSTREI